MLPWHDGAPLPLSVNDGVVACKYKRKCPTELRHLLYKIATLHAQQSSDTYKIAAFHVQQSSDTYKIATFHAQQNTDTYKIATIPLPAT